MRSVPVPLAGPVDPESGPRSRATALDPVAFVQELDRELLRALARSGEQARATVPPSASLLEPLVAALREEIETAEVAATWLTDEPDLALRLGLARQVGDEARHFEAIGERIRELGADPGGDARTRAHSALFRYLRGLQTPAERLAAGLAREAFSRLRSGLVAEVAESQGDRATAALFREVLGPDEIRHIDFCRRELPRYALTGEDQDAARRAVARTLQLAEEAADPTRPAKASPAPPAEPPPNSR